MRYLQTAVEHSVIQFGKFMDKKTERSNADKVLRLFAKSIKELGFIRTKPTFFVREADLVLEFIHLHKYSFGSCFRMHICFRVLNEDLDFLVLAGVTEQDLLDNARFDYGESIESVQACAFSMSEFVLRFANPWFEKFRDRSLLLKNDSPLYDDQKLALKAAMAGKSKAKNTQTSKSLLKIV